MMSIFVCEEEDQLEHKVEKIDDEDETVMDLVKTWQSLN